MVEDSVFLALLLDFTVDIYLQRACNFSIVHLKRQQVTVRLWVIAS